MTTATNNNNRVNRKSYNNRFKSICYVCIQNKAVFNIRITLKNGNDSTIIPICTSCLEIIDKNHKLETADLK